MSLAPACAWTLKGDYRFEGDWTQFGELGGGGAGGWALVGAEGEFGLESWTALVVVWTSRTLLGDRG